MKKLNCPHCKASFPRWRLILRIRSPVCPVCKSNSDFSVESAQRIGAIGGLILGVISGLTAFVFGAEKVWTWGFWGVMLPFSYVLSCISALAVGELVPNQHGSWGRNKWNLFPNVSGIRRKFLWLGFTVFPICALMLSFAHSLPLPIWLVSALTFIIVVVAVLGLIGTWDIVFGERGVFRRQKSDGAA